MLHVRVRNIMTIISETIQVTSAEKSPLSEKKKQFLHTLQYTNDILRFLPQI